MLRSTYRPSGYGAPRVVFSLRGPHVSPQIGSNGRWDRRCWDCSYVVARWVTTPPPGLLIEGGGLSRPSDLGRTSTAFWEMEWRIVSREARGRPKSWIACRSTIATARRRLRMLVAFCPGAGERKIGTASRRNRREGIKIRGIPGS